MALVQLVWVSVQRSKAGFRLALPGSGSKAMYGLTFMEPVRRGWASRGDGVQGLAVGAATSLGRAVAVASMGSVRTPPTTAAVWESP